MSAFSCRRLCPAACAALLVLLAPGAAFAASEGWVGLSGGVALPGDRYTGSDVVPILASEGAPLVFGLAGGLTVASVRELDVELVVPVSVALWQPDGLPADVVDLEAGAGVRLRFAAHPSLRPHVETVAGVAYHVGTLELGILGEHTYTDLDPMLRLALGLEVDLDGPGPVSVLLQPLEIALDFGEDGPVTRLGMRVGVVVGF